MTALVRIVSDLSSMHEGPQQYGDHFTHWFKSAAAYDTAPLIVQSLERGGELGAALAIQCRLLSHFVITYSAMQVSAMIRLLVLNERYHRRLSSLAHHFFHRPMPKSCFLFGRLRGRPHPIGPELDEFWEHQDITGESVLHWILDYLGNGNAVVGTDDLESRLRRTVRPTHPADNHGRTLLHVAAQRNLPGIVHALLDAGLDPNAQTVTGSTALHYAASMGHFDVCRRLLGSMDKLNINIEDISHETALQYAAQKGQIKVLELLLVEGASVVTESGTDALTLAVERGHIPAVKLMLATPRVLHVLQDIHRRPDALFYTAVQTENLDMIKLLLNTPGIRINAKVLSNDGDEITALGWALQPADIEVIRLLLGTSGLEVDSPDYLRFSIDRDDEEIVELLLQTPLSISTINSEINEDDETTLHWAAQEGHTDIVKMLLETEGTDVNSQNCGGQTPLMSALAERQICYKEFLQHPGVEWSIRDAVEWTPLHFAAGWETGPYSVIADVLPFCSRYINVRDIDGETALHIVVDGTPSDDRTKAVRALLQVEGIEVGAKNYIGRTPLHIAARSGDMEACRLLMVWMDEVSSFEDEQGDTPSSLALLRGHVVLHRLLMKFEDRVTALADDKQSGTDDDEDISEGPSSSEELSGN